MSGKKVALIALTRGGGELARKLAAGLGSGTDIYLPARFALPGESSQPGQPGERVHTFDRPLAGLAGDLFPRYRGFVFIMAMGVVVRLIAPYVRDKRFDPAVVVVDERGRFAVSLLSGHLGGANELAKAVAGVAGGQAVITTATDVNGGPALDVLARDMGWGIEPARALPRVQAAIVNGDRVVIYSDLDEQYLRARLAGLLAPGETLPDNLDVCSLDDYGRDVAPGSARYGDVAARVLITGRNLAVPGTPVTLFVRPRNIIAGVGCRRGVAAEAVREAVGLALARAGLTAASLGALASIDLKRGEAGLRSAARGLGVPLICVGRDEIARLEAEGGFRSSPFVKAKTGVGCVCEPAAVLAGKNTGIVLGKTTFPETPGVAVALAHDRTPEVFPACSG